MWGGGGVKISLSSLINYFSVSGDSKHKKNFRQKKLVPSPQLGEGGGSPLCGGHHPKAPIFFLTPLIPLFINFGKPGPFFGKPDKFIRRQNFWPFPG